MPGWRGGTRPPQSSSAAGSRRPAGCSSQRQSHPQTGATQPASQPWPPAALTCAAAAWKRASTPSSSQMGHAMPLESAADSQPARRKGSQEARGYKCNLLPSEMLRNAPYHPWQRLVCFRLVCQHQHPSLELPTGPAVRESVLTTCPAHGKKCWDEHWHKAHVSPCISPFVQHQAVVHSWQVEICSMLRAPLRQPAP